MSGVTGALQAFETKGLIETARGSITVADRGGFEESANGLYGPPETEYEKSICLVVASKRVSPVQQ